MAKTTSTEKTTRSLASDSKNPAQENPAVTTMEASKSPLSDIVERNTSSWSTYHENWIKKTESVEECQDCKATAASMMPAKAAEKAAKAPWLACPTGEACETITTYISAESTVMAWVLCTTSQCLQD